MTLSRLLSGIRVRLTALDRDDVEPLLAFYSDVDFLRHLDAIPAMPRTRHQIEELLKEYNKPETFMFAIRTHEDDTLVGYCGLSGISWPHGTGWLEIGIGLPEYRRQGYATDAMILLIDFIFRELNLHRVQLSVFEYNQAAIALYQKLGFIHEGTFRESLQRDGRRYDMLFYGLLRRDWQSPE